MTKVELEARRDSSAIECVTDYRGDKDQYAEVGLECYKHGWDSCAALLQVEMDKYSESMRFYMSELQSANAKLAVAKIAIKDFLDCSGNIEQNDERLGWLKEALAAMDASEGNGNKNE